MHAGWSFDAGGPQRCGCEIEQADHLIVYRACFVLLQCGKVLRPMDDRGDMQSAVPAPVYPPCFQSAIVGEEDDHGIVGQIVFSPLFQNPSGPHIGR